MKKIKHLIILLVISTFMTNCNAQTNGNNTGEIEKETRKIENNTSSNVIKKIKFRNKSYSLIVIEENARIEIKDIKDSIEFNSLESNENYYYSINLDSNKVSSDTRRFNFFGGIKNNYSFINEDSINYSEGIFLIDSLGKPHVFKNDSLLNKNKTNTIAYTTESSNMIALKGYIYNSSNDKSKDFSIRNGIGVNGKGSVVLVSSIDSVSSSELVSLFKDRLKCKEALIDFSNQSFTRDSIVNPFLVVYKNNSITYNSDIISSREFQHKRYTIVEVNSEEYKIELYNRLNNYETHDFGTILNEKNENNDTLLFAMNAGMYNENLLPVGLFISDGELENRINLKPKGYGNFYSLPPNGVFALDDKSKPFLVVSNDFKKLSKKHKIILATQSGPMMVINGVFNKAFNQGSHNLNIRNGVGINDKGNVIFVISEQPVNFYEFSQFFRDELKCKDALYLDGVISQWFSPNIHDERKKYRLGPIITISNK